MIFQTPRGAVDAVTVTGDTADRSPPAVVDSLFLLLFDTQHLYLMQNFTIYAATFSVLRGMAVLLVFATPHCDAVHPRATPRHRAQHPTFSLLRTGHSFNRESWPETDHTIVSAIQFYTRQR